MLDYDAYEKMKKRRDERANPANKHKSISMRTNIFLTLLHTVF